jgi:Ulp1 family protease
MAISTLEYPVVVPQGTEPPADGPRPYIGNNDDINLAYFREEASEEEWDRYNGWIREQSETRRPYNAQVVDAHSEQIMTRDVFTLRFDEYIMDDVLHYVIKSLRDKLGMDDIPVAFFPSFFFTKLYQKGHADPKLENKYCYKGVAGWTKRMLRGKPIDKMKTIVFF